MIDLDAIQARIDKVAGIGDDHTTWWQIGTHDAPTLVAELRAAREVIEMARKGFPRILEGDVRRAAMITLADYDKVTGEAAE